MIDEQDDDQNRDYNKGWEEGYERGLKVGERAGHIKGHAKGIIDAARPKRKNEKNGRPPKYPFALLEPGQAVLVPERDAKKVYAASRQYSARRGHTLRYRCHGHPGGTLIARHDGYSRHADGDIIRLDNPDYDWIA